VTVDFEELCHEIGSLLLSVGFGASSKRAILASDVPFPAELLTCALHF
jgi:hypothetical protein